MTHDDRLTDVDSRSLAFVEALYADYLEDPDSVSPAWRDRFAEETRTSGVSRGIGRGPSFRTSSIFNPTCQGGACAIWQTSALQERVIRLVHAYRVRGHMVARTDPLGRPRWRPPELDLDYHGLSEADLERTFTESTASGGREEHSLRTTWELLQETYCRSIGVQFMHISDQSVRNWLQVRMEGTRNRLTLSRDEQLEILTELSDAVIFEEFIQKKYIGAKRFSLEGAESLIPLLTLVIEKAGDDQLDELVLGMAHRGRLNVLANVIGKSPHAIFREFEDVEGEIPAGGGDVKYHLGYTSRRTTRSGHLVHISLCFNPSHLEFVNPVVQGRLRAKQDRVGDSKGDRGMAVLIHGDAAMAGQGIVQETLNMSQLPGYFTGGTLHVVVNNQIGFTTFPRESRSSAYATGVAQMLQIPIFHVNGEDPEAVAQVVRLAMDFRKTFRRDVVIDMYCYRRYGHNEADEPAFTHPEMYEAIRKRKSVREGYLDHLLALGGVTREEADEIAKQRRERLETDLSIARSKKYAHRVDVLSGGWRKMQADCGEQAGEERAAVSIEHLRGLLRGLTDLPDGFDPHPKLNRFLESRRKMAAGESPLDWAAAEALAFASLVESGHPIRFSGQDSPRGTFSHRHAILHDRRDGTPYCALQHVSEGQARFEILNSPLSEAGALGFEYGYSNELPEGLVIWEAQFGDFVNAAQVIIDQFLSSGEDKWRLRSGLVLLLPHGFEGQGPEHSSARPERFLQLCAEDNMQVVVPTTPAQYFRLFRCQVKRPWRKPLVVMTPKSLLRHTASVSSLEDLADGGFRRIISDENPTGGVKRILLCTGKVYYDLSAYREEHSRGDVAILRLEQLYPLSPETVEAELAAYPDDVPLIWVQEEPENMGAWGFLLRVLCRNLTRGRSFTNVSRKASASPATGSTTMHRIEQKQLVDMAFNGPVQDMRVADAAKGEES